MVYSGSKGQFWCKSLERISKEAAILKIDCSFQLGEGSRTRFWEDVWCEELPLCESFPALYNLARTKGAKVAELWESARDSGTWNLRFSRTFND